MIVKTLVLLLAVSQPLVAYLSVLGDRGSIMMNGTNPLITPASYAFSIWSIICLGSVLYGLYQFRSSRRNTSLYESIEPYAVGVFIGFSAWLYAAHMEWIWATVVILIWMSYCLYKIYVPIVRAAHAGLLSKVEYIVTYGTFGLYAGWATVATYANIAAALKYYGVYDMGTIGILWQACILISAGALALGGVRIYHGSTPYTAAVVWAFIAIVVSTAGSWPASGILPFVAGCAVLAVLIQYGALRHRAYIVRE